MVSKWNDATSSLTFVHPRTKDALSPEITITNWDAKDYGSLVWESEPLPSEVNRWTIKLKWEIWYYPQGQPSQKRYVFETNTHVIYATVGEPLSCGIEDYKSPWYTNWTGQRNVRQGEHPQQMLWKPSQGRCMICPCLITLETPNGCWFARSHRGARATSS